MAGRNWGTAKTKTYAFFGSVDYDLTPTLTLNLGARQTYEKKDLLWNLDGSNTGNLALGSVTNYKDDQSYSKFTPTAGLTFHLDNNHTAYVKYATGFKSGGWNADFISQAQLNAGIRFNPETVDSYEAGIKGTALGQRLQYDLAVFRSNFKDYQVQQFVNLGGPRNEFVLRNAAKAESKGLEASVRSRVSEHLTLGASLGLLNAEYQSFPGGLTPSGADAAGKKLARAPKTSGAVTVNYARSSPSIGGRLDFYGECSYQSESYVNVNNDPSYGRIASRTLVNLHVGYMPNRGQWMLGLWTRNLLDKNYLTDRTSDVFGNQSVRRGAPRMFGADLSYQF